MAVPTFSVGAALPGEAARVEVGALATLLLILLVLVLVGALPAWPYSSGWGYYPSGALTVILLIVLILFLTGRL